MSESDPKNATTQATSAKPIIREVEPTHSTSNVASATPVADNNTLEADNPTEQQSSSSYVDLYQNP
jgi:hypothetical protein